MMNFEKFRTELAEFRKHGYTDFEVMVSSDELELRLTAKNPSGCEIELMALYKPRKDKLARLAKEAGLFAHWIEADRVYREKGK